jgi:putative nucleotidyltransferase with HDIG domain
MADQRILVVDDETAVRDVMCSILSQAGFECRPVASAHDALAVLRSNENISIVLSDLIMEGVDGLTLLSRMKEVNPDIPVVMVTAVHDISVALAAIRNGAYDYLLKPFEREQLLAMVRRALETRRLRLENLAYQTNLESLVSARTEMLRKALADLERSYDITLEALGDALDLKDAETEGHSKRVTAFTIAIARAMEMPQDKVRIIARGAFLHDVGKMAIPDAILRKPGRLSAEEQAIMREHASLGYQMLRKIPCKRRPTSYIRTRNATMAAAIPAASRATKFRWEHGYSRSLTPSTRSLPIALTALPNPFLPDGARLNATPANSSTRRL